MRLQDFIRLSPRSKADKYLKLQKKLAVAELKIKELHTRLEKEKKRYDSLGMAYSELRTKSEGVLEFIAKEFPDCILCPPRTRQMRFQPPCIEASEPPPISYVPFEHLTYEQFNRTFSTIKLWHLVTQMREDGYNRGIYLRCEDPDTKACCFYVSAESMQFLANNEKVAFLHDIFKDLFKHLLSQWRDK